MTDGDAFRRVFMTPKMARRYEWHSRRLPGTRLERCERLWKQLKEKERNGSDRSSD